MSKNLKQFLEADALRTQGAWRRDALAGITAIAGHVADVSLSFNADNDAAFIAAASRIAPDIRQLLAAFEEVCEALDKVEHDLAVPTYLRELSGAMLEAAAPWRKLMENV